MVFFLRWFRIVIFQEIPHWKLQTWQFKKTTLWGCISYWETWCTVPNKNRKINPDCFFFTSSEFCFEWMNLDKFNIRSTLPGCLPPRFWAYYRRHSTFSGETGTQKRWTCQTPRMNPRNNPWSLSQDGTRSIKGYRNDQEHMKAWKDMSLMDISWWFRFWSQ